MNEIEKVLACVLIFCLLGIILMMGCLIVFPPDNGTPIAQTTEKYVITGIDPPKHFYIDLEKDGVKYTHIYVSKHFNNYREIKMNSEIVLTRRTLKFKDGHETSEFLNVREALEGLLINEGKY